ncbi:MAG: peptide chain release factor N(5)-glutamine methyltransferase, partial [Pacificimonas sp.]
GGQAGGSGRGRGLSGTAADIRRGAAILSAGAQPGTARLDAELLAAHLAGVERGQLLLDMARHAMDGDAYAALIARRASGEPLAYITGNAEFWSLPFRVTPDTLIPRADSESLIEAALAHLPRPPLKILDLGTGSGCLLLAALSEYPGAQGLGVDASDAALAVAADNAARLGMAERTGFQQGDWCAGVTGAYDLILCNPPYVDRADMLGPGVREYEPGAALFAADSGLSDYRLILPQLAGRLTADGLAIFEIGAGQAGDVRRIAADSGLAFVAGRADLGGHERALLFRRS